MAGGAVWYSADSHLRHALVTRLRGFESRDDHDETIISRWNAAVDDNDLVWHLGDVGLGNEGEVLRQAGRLKGHKQLITGNHDRCWPGHRDARKYQRAYLEVFESVQAFARVRIAGQDVLLSHFPYSGDHSAEDRYSAFRLKDDSTRWLLHGHTHSPERMRGAGTGDRQVHVGLDAWNLAPVHASEIEKILRTS